MHTEKREREIKTIFPTINFPSATFIIPFFSHRHTQLHQCQIKAMHTQNIVLLLFYLSLSLFPYGIDWIFSWHELLLYAFSLSLFCVCIFVSFMHVYEWDAFSGKFMDILRINAFLSCSMQFTQDTFQWAFKSFTMSYLNSSCSFILSLLSLLQCW